MAKALHILADGFEDVEAVTALDILRRAAVEVTVAGLDGNMVTGARGTRVTPDTTLETVRGGVFDALVLPGGTRGAENLAASPLVREWVLAFHKAGKIIAAICAAPAIVLAPLGVLDGRSATCFPGMEDRFQTTTLFKTDPVVVDGALITSRALGTALAFSLALAEKLTDRSTAERVRRAVLG